MPNRQIISAPDQLYNGSAAAIYLSTPFRKLAVHTSAVEIRDSIPFQYLSVKLLNRSVLYLKIILHVIMASLKTFHRTVKSCLMHVCQDWAFWFINSIQSVTLLLAKLLLVWHFSTKWVKITGYLKIIKYIR